MTALARARSALHVTFAIYACEGLLAAQATLPAATELGRLLPPGLPRDLDGALLLEALDTLASLARSSLLSLALAALLILLIAPWLHVAWLLALRSPHSLSQALSHAAGLLPRAWLVSLLVLALALPFALACAGLTYALHLGFDGDARVHDLAVLASLGAWLLLGFVASVLHDLGRAHALECGAWQALRAGLRGCLRPRLLFTALGSTAIAALLVVAGQLAAAALPSALVWGTVSLLLLQLSLLARRFTRSVWLACVVAQLAPRAHTNEVREEVHD